MSNDNRTGDNEQGKGIMKAMLSSMWGYWLFLLAISFGLAAGVYLIWLRGNI